MDPLIIFFFSSRRRHTRLQGDWSSDVCSSDLGGLNTGAEAMLDLGDEIFGVEAHVRMAGHGQLSPRHDVRDGAGAYAERSEERRVGTEAQLLSGQSGIGSIHAGAAGQYTRGQA